MLTIVIYLSLVGCFGTFDPVYTRYFNGTIISKDALPLDSCFFSLISKKYPSVDEKIKLTSHFIKIERRMDYGASEYTIEINCGEDFQVNRINDLKKYLRPDSAMDYDLGVIVMNPRSTSQPQGRRVGGA